MKRLIPAGIILIFIVTLCVGSNVYVKKTCKQTITDIEDYYTECITSDKNSINSLSQNLKSEWNSRKDKLELFVNHTFLDNISLQITKLITHIVNENHESALLDFEQIKELFEQVISEQTFSLNSFY